MNFDFRQTEAQDKSDSLATIIYENYDDDGEFFDYEYVDTEWFPPVEQRRRPPENERKFSQNFIKNKKSHFADDYRPNYHKNSPRLSDPSRKVERPSLYREILQSKLRGQQTSTFKGDWVRPHQQRKKQQKRKSPLPPLAGKPSFYQKRRKGPPPGRPLRVRDSDLFSSCLRTREYSWSVLLPLKSSCRVSCDRGSTTRTSEDDATSVLLLERRWRPGKYFE